MAKEVRMLEARHKKTRIPGVLAGGNRYICVERLMAAAVPGIKKEDKRTLSKKLAALADEYGGAFRAKMAGADRWFMTRQLLSEGLAREIAAYRNGTYARFAASILERVDVLARMLQLSGKISKRGFHRTEDTVIITIDKMFGKTAPMADIDAVLAEAAEMLRNAGVADAGPGTGDGAADAEPGGACDGQKVRDEAPDARVPAAIPEEIIGILSNSAALPEAAAMKLQYRMCALSAVLARDLCGDALMDAILTVRDVLIRPYRTVKYSEWLAVFGITPDAEWMSEHDRDCFDEKAFIVAEACRGVWGSNSSGPVKSMYAQELLVSCLTKI